MSTVTCTVCGASEEPGPDHTCPVCGADLPAPEPNAPDSAVGPMPDDAEAANEPAPPGGPPAPDGPAAGPAAPPPAPPPAQGRPPAGPRRSPYDPSHPSGLSDSLRTYGMFTHLSAFVGAAATLAFVGPLVMWLIRRDEHPFLDHHGKEALNFNLSLLLYGVVGIIVSIVTVGMALIVVIPAAVVLVVTWIITTILAAIKASRGEGYRYPLTIRFIAD